MSEQDVLAAVRALAPAVRARAHEAEALCRVPDATIKELATVGLFRLVQPRLHGGLAADPAVFLDCIRELARACGSTGWVIGVFGCNTWQLSLYDPRAQEDVWGVDRDARICSSIAPVGQVARVEGGYRLNGRWGFSSGSDHADWVMLGGMVRDDDGKPVEMRHFLLPRTDYAVDRVWDTVGLRGTGSNDVVVENAFVPAHRTIGAEQIASRIRPGHAVNPEPLYRLPMGSVFTSTISTPIVGMAEAAYQGYLDATRDRIKVAGMSRAAEDPFTQARVGRAASDIDAAWLQLVRNISDLYDCAKRGEDADGAAHPAAARPGARHRTLGRRGGPAGGERGRRRDAHRRQRAPARVARRAQRPRPRRQRPGTGTGPVRAQRVRLRRVGPHAVNPHPGDEMPSRRNRCASSPGHAGSTSRSSAPPWAGSRRDSPSWRRSTRRACPPD